ncbi:MAG TPA: carboxylesterase/lipase family protein [Candidatus Dormibacteraeota bacterium]|nr:carboxylesterase/lipase family protein [Candidatus Dormibacteraeota bacterium]
MRWLATRRSLFCALAAGLAVACGCSGGGTPRTVDPNMVRVSDGALKGRVSGGVRTFLGIPYAAPPVGPLRWKAPQPAAPWTGTRDATAPGSRCAQSAAQGVSTTEDCLFLNVWTPVPVRSRLPVMVWIHGGAFTGGSGSDYDAGLLVQKGRVIVVTINYRLGPLGFLDLPALADEAADHSAGMYWLQDQQAALRWVRSNIAAFGGDARNVTIFGESAGGQSVCYHLASPLSAGLFERAITESGPCADRTQTPAAAQTTGTRFAQQLGCGDPATVLACLRALPVTTLINAPVGGPAAIEPWTGNVDGVELKASVADAIKSGAFNRVPTIEGTTHDEYRLFVALLYDDRAGPVTAGQYTTTIQTVFAARAEQVLEQYPLSAFASPSLALSTVITDSVFSCPARSADRALAAAGVPTYAYEFADPTAPPLVPDPVMPMGASHASELAYVFQRSASGLTSTEVALSDRMIGYWTTFAASGTPGGAGAPAWPRYSAAGDQFLELTPAGPRPSAGFAQDHHCSFWAP